MSHKPNHFKAPTNNNKMLIIDYLMEFEGKKQQIKKQYKMALCLQLGVKLYHFISLSLCCGQKKKWVREHLYQAHTSL